MRINQNLSILVLEGKAYHVLVGEKDSCDHYFGGSGLQSGSKDGERPLQLQALFNFDCSDSRLNRMARFGRLPLYYSFACSGSVEYTIEDGSQLRLIAMNPDEPQPDWPYRDYPLDFPLSPVRLEAIEFGDLKEVITSYAYFADLHFNGGRFDSRRFAYVVVTPCKEYGVSLWGEDGDAEFVTVGFSVDLQTGAITGSQALS